MPASTRTCFQSRTPASWLELDDSADGAAPGQLACLRDGELVVGWGTITSG